MNTNVVHIGLDVDDTNFPDAQQLPDTVRRAACHAGGALAGPSGRRASRARRDVVRILWVRASDDLVTIEHTVFVTVDAHPHTRSWRNTGQRDLLSRYVGQLTEVEKGQLRVSRGIATKQA